MIYLSDEQMNIVGMTGGGDVQASWVPVVPPVGRQQIPAWSKGLNVDLALPYANSPRFQLKCDRQLRDWEGKTFTKQGDRYMAVSEDGRAEVYYQGGGLSRVKLKRYRTADGKLHAHPPYEPNRTENHDEAGNVTWSGHKHVPGEWVEVERLCTGQERGFGGAHIDLVLDDGREVTLRGPWHGGCPEGFVEVSYVDTTHDASFGWFRKRPWHQRGGIGGLFLSEAAFLPIFATYAPHMLLAHVDLGRGPRLEAYLAEWVEPKAWWMARRRMAEQQAKFDATPIDQRPPTPRCYSYKLCAGKATCQTNYKCPTHPKEKDPCN